MFYAIHGGGQTFPPRNYFVALNKDLGVGAASLIADESDHADLVPFAVNGFEDCRLFDLGGEWHAAAIMRDRHPAGLNQIGLLRLAEDGFHDLRLLRGPEAGQPEKNWMPLVVGGDLLFVYSCYPTVVFRCESASGALSTVSRRPAPEIARSFRGGSQGVGVDRGFLFVVHETVAFEDNNRVYPHRFVLLDDDFALAQVSPQFFFRGRGLEFCAGLAQRGDRLVASFGVDEAEAYLATMALGEVLAALSPVVEPDRGWALAGGERAPLRTSRSGQGAVWTGGGKAGWELSEMRQCRR